VNQPGLWSAGCWLANDLLEVLLKFVSMNGLGSQAGQVARLLLAVDESNATGLTAQNQSGQTDLGAIGPSGEHTLPEDHLSQLHKIEARQKRLVLVEAKAVGEALGVKPQVGRPNVWGDPGPGLARSWLAAGLNNLVKVLVEPQGQALALTLPCRLSDGPMQPKVGDTKDHAGVWRPPENGLSRARPRKDAALVGTHQQGRA
jgi:hypothetical protein